MHFPFTSQHKESGVDGAIPQAFAGTAAPDGDALPWAAERVGSIYVQVTGTANQYIWEKRKNSLRDDDWGPLSGMHCISQTVARSAFTDGGSTSGTFVLTQAVPEGAYFFKTLLTGLTGFTGDTSATIIVGDGTDTDRYMTGTPSVFTTDTSLDVGAVSGTAYHDAAKSVTITITSNTDFTLVTAGQLTIRMFYIL